MDNHGSKALGAVSQQQVEEEVLLAVSKEVAPAMQPEAALPVGQTA